MTIECECGFVADGQLDSMRTAGRYEEAAKRCPVCGLLIAERHRPGPGECQWHGRDRRPGKGSGSIVDHEGAHLSRGMQSRRARLAAGSGQGGVHRGRLGGVLPGDGGPERL